MPTAAVFCTSVVLHAIGHAKARFPVPSPASLPVALPGALRHNLGVGFGPWHDGLPLVCRLVAQWHAQDAGLDRGA